MRFPLPPPSSVRKILAPIKIKSALPPPPKPPPKRGILWTWVFLQKERIFPGVHKIGAAISGPRIADTNFTDTRIFLIQGQTKQKRREGQRDVQTHPWSRTGPVGTKSPQYVLANRKNDVYVTRNVVLNFNFVTFFISVTS